MKIRLSSLVFALAELVLGGSANEGESLANPPGGGFTVAPVQVAISLGVVD
jgi:hypothetical protein